VKGGEVKSAEMAKMKRKKWREITEKELGGKSTKIKAEYGIFYVELRMCYSRIKVFGLVVGRGHFELSLSQFTKKFTPLTN
jgi:hypothetical protein